MTSAGPILLGVTLVVALGAAHGVDVDRWRTSAQLEEALARVGRVPAVVGDWTGEELALEPEDMGRAGIKGWSYRRYRHVRTGEAVSVLLVCGRGGPISVHTPDVCYTGAGYRQLGDVKPSAIDPGESGRHTFQMTRFQKTTGTVPTQLEVYWSWSRDGQSWQAPENPRLSFARSPALYKLYVVREFVPGSRAETSDACQAFLRGAIPAIGQQFAPAPQ